MKREKAIVVSTRKKKSSTTGVTHSASSRVKQFENEKPKRVRKKAPPKNTLSKIVRKQLRTYYGLKPRDAFTDEQNKIYNRLYGRALRRVRAGIPKNKLDFTDLITATIEGKRGSIIIDVSEYTKKQPQKKPRTRKPKQKNYVPDATDITLANALGTIQTFEDTTVQSLDQFISMIESMNLGTSNPYLAEIYSTNRASLIKALMGAIQSEGKVSVAKRIADSYASLEEIATAVIYSSNQQTMRLHLSQFYAMLTGGSMSVEQAMELSEQNESLSGGW